MTNHANATVTYGRGGAGNVTTKTKHSPSFEPQTTPSLKSKTYTTGRGGTGNMAKNDFEHPEEARRAQDVDVPAITIPEGVHHTGRGGAANLYKPTEEEQRKARAHNEKVRSDSFNKERSTIRSLAEKTKETLTGSHSDDK
ncbi:hypothetical protein AYO21_10796 [Fonsecaea monophora]|uniref:Uncharacterized protein n=2 Tax=Fonsecaea TaxID=40354 RepID=A0A0D2H131_9EURO|nr:uncharacterized protein Z517_03800 [Fonsecaea pedrosoi CBS 271.37]XP_022506961.1 hypothetical protein AYO21_10796 [Fonsecaea monophora]KAH0836248.1 hypothetical protein FOPE_04486 [Fonsecaea pedrosoi]KIW84550.1 hypothetical protein Z517_03800 [Fonsecaea pedrosoi CBS 271.37]OAG35009.1 hypothetical protein AYO21_10796 [Fonsecaea monophora]